MLSKFVMAASWRSRLHSISVMAAKAATQANPEFVHVEW
jgi:hypothetical protein